MVPKPNADLTGFRRAFVKYQDAVTMSRARLLGLRVDVGLAGKEGSDPSQPLLTQMSTGFWTEHSERGTMSTYMQMAQVGPEVRKMVGRWSFSQEEEYLRHLETSIRMAQGAVAKMLLRWEPSLKVLEDQILANLGNYLKEREVSEEEINLVMQNLALPKDDGGYGDDIAQLEVLREVQKVRGDEPMSSRATTVFSPTSAIFADPAEQEETEDEGEGEGEPMLEPQGTFVFSIVGSCNRRTLHRVGECWQVPGVHYRNYMVAGEDRPPLGAGDRECRDCFGRNLALASAEQLAMTSSSSSQEED